MTATKTFTNQGILQHFLVRCSRPFSWWQWIAVTSFSPVISMGWQTRPSKWNGFGSSSSQHHPQCRNQASNAIRTKKKSQSISEKAKPTFWCLILLSVLYKSPSTSLAFEPHLLFRIISCTEGRGSGHPEFSPRRKSRKALGPHVMRMIKVLVRDRDWQAYRSKVHISSRW